MVDFCLVANSVILFLPFDFGAIICDTIGNFQINRIIQFVILSSVFMPTDVSTIINFIINTPGLAMANQYIGDGQSRHSKWQYKSARKKWNRSMEIKEKTDNKIKNKN
ncbi:hypothetical protein DERF_002708 [Dermatophagoides farinae]|uniref:Uncharacterized protein n=1 Tax=Dermatophagoides farinae TaxID=6954 RepID=A0A922IG24_DERFA|nr:hypothetical protein DERF_002708 [Dermatophagoides farinae]